MKFDMDKYIEKHCNYDVEVSAEGRVRKVGVKEHGVRPRLGRKAFWIKLSDLRKYEKQKLSERQIAKIYGISQMGLKKIRDMYVGWARKYKEVERTDKGKVGIRVSLEEQKKKRLAYMRKYSKNRPKYKGKRIRLPDGRSVVRQVHRLVMEEHLGRKLRKD